MMLKIAIQSSFGLRAQSAAGCWGLICRSIYQANALSSIFDRRQQLRSHRVPTVPVASAALSETIYPSPSISVAVCRHGRSLPSPSTGGFIIRGSVAGALGGHRMPRARGGGQRRPGVGPAQPREPHLPRRRRRCMTTRCPAVTTRVHGSSTYALRCRSEVLRHGAVPPSLDCF